MSVGTFVLAVRRSPIIATNKVVVSFSLTATGDGSGGNISCSQAIGAYLPQKYVATVLDCGFHNNDAAGRAQHCGLTTGEWEALPHANLVISNSTEELTAGGTTTFYYSRINCSPYLFPLYVGRNLVSDPTFAYLCATNTNTKTYTAWLRIMCEQIG